MPDLHRVPQPVPEIPSLEFMCSTPFGIKGGRTSCRDRNAVILDVLNAFRHQRGSHSPDQLQRAASLWSAQRLSASKGVAQTERGKRPLGQSVLNAFRHQRGSHVKSLMGKVLAFQCSTPFGIKGGRTNNGTVMRFNGTGAQRLSASKGVARAGERAHPDGLRCVLNAFRHQRGSHVCVGRQPSSACKCSTPFGIKGGRTIGMCRVLGRYGPCSTPFGIKGGRTRQLYTYRRLYRVLNAFRHQRGSHLPALDTDFSLCSWCSTPFGIKGGRTEVSLESGICFISCSTPFGIKGGRTSSGWRKTTCLSRCSTPFGIKGGRTPPWQKTLGSRWRVLNAFRHQRGSHLDGRREGQKRGGVLNAFRHQRGSHLRGKRDRRGSVRVLNAFRHQRGSH